MSFGTDVGLATLAFVTRSLKGSISQEKVKFDPKKKENVREHSKVFEPVIVFFPNGTCQVLPMKTAKSKGFLERPSILNFEAVTDASTVAGKFKFAMTDEERNKNWLLMEEAVINRCLARTGHPVPLDVEISEQSIFAPKHEGVAA